MRLLLAPACLALGFVSGLTAMLVHQYVWGTVLGVLAGAAAWLALPRTWSGRPAFGAGWAVAAGLGSTTRPEGDFLVPADVLGYTFLGFSALVFMAGFVTLPTRTRSPRTASPLPPPA